MKENAKLMTVLTQNTIDWTRERKCWGTSSEVMKKAIGPSAVLIRGKENPNQHE